MSIDLLIFKKCGIIFMLHARRVKMDKKNLVGKGKGVKFERIRRITGYLVGTVERFNDGKRAEEHDRVKHDFDVKKEN